MTEKNEAEKLLSSSSESSVSSNEDNKETIKSKTVYQSNLTVNGIPSIKQENLSKNNSNTMESQTTTIRIPKKHLIWFASLMIISLLTFVIIISLMLVLTVKASQLTQQSTAIYETQKKEPQVIKMGSFINEVLQNQITKPEFIISPVSTSASTKESVTLNCQFNTDVNCYWMRNEQILDIEDRYQYVHVPQQRDCSITISSINELDFGSWQCGCHGSDQYNGIKSNPVLISKSLAFTQVSTNKTSKMGKSVILECAFNQAVSCFWMRNGGPIEISDRYSFVQGSSNSEDSRADCSIKISNIQTIDFGSWSCGASNEKAISSPILLSKEIHDDSKDLLNDQSSNLMVNELTQKEIHAEEFVKQPVDVYAKRGSKVHLDCEFARPVTCAWLRNDQHVDIQGRYQYYKNDNNNKKDCSITISNLQANDMGQWICSSMADSNGDGVKSQTVTVKIS